MQLFHTSLIITALLIFTCYNVFFIAKKAGIPKHLSESYYVFRYRQSFSILLLVLTILLAPFWITINLKLQSPFLYLTLLVSTSFILLASIKNYASSKTRRILHHIFAWVGGLSTIAWIHLTCPDFLRNVPRILLIFFLLIGLFTKSIKYSYRYYLELICFYSIMIVLLYFSFTNSSI